ncbi:MAG: hypothetical protein V4808_16980 [Pseudomonadota bacterium]
MLLRLSMCLLFALIFAPLPAAAQIDDTDYSAPELTQADAVTVRRELSQMREWLNTGTTALANEDWVTAQYSCFKAQEMGKTSSYGAQDAYSQARTIGRTCMADAAYHRGNKSLACDWWPQVNYESLLDLDPRAICASRASNETAPVAANERTEAAANLPGNMAPIFKQIGSLSSLSNLAYYGFSRFGMSPDEVVAASGGAMKRIPGRSGTDVFNLSKLVEGPARTGDAFNFHFSKADERLMMVKVILRAEVCASLDVGLEKIWGKPLVAEHKQWTASFRSDLIRWQVAAGDLVTMSRSTNQGQPDECHILFQPPGTTF